MFEEKKKRDLSLFRLIVGLSVVAALGYGGVQLYGQVGGERGAAVLSEAPERLTEARSLLGSGDYAGVIDTLSPLKNQITDTQQGPEVWALLARATTRTDGVDAALPMARRAVEGFGPHRDRPLYATLYAQLLEQSGALEEAEAIFAEVAETAPPELRAAAVTGLGRVRERAGELIPARDLYADAVRDAAFQSDAWFEAVEALGDANVALFFGQEETPESQVYVVQPGDTLTAIGVRLNTTLGSLTRANGITEETPLRVGQRLKYTPKDFRIVIDRSDNRLYVVDSQGIFKMYRVGLGAPGSETTPGSYRIGDKIKDPTWHKPGEGPIPPGDPRNELATRWMQMVPEEEGLPKDLGIHGTLSPETIGFHSSNGCARMLTPEVEELYDIVVRSTPVLVVDGVTTALLTPQTIEAR